VTVLEIPRVLLELQLPSPQLLVVLLLENLPMELQQRHRQRWRHRERQRPRLEGRSWQQRHRHWQRWSRQMGGVVQLNVEGLVGCERQPLNARL
jgi:hypothetical protein